MYFQIRSVVLWPRDVALDPRIVSFEPGMANVVMGGSRTGKSAIIPIIDYCLTARTCAIPKKVIRTACTWFGIVVETANGQRLFARREPGDQQASDEMFIAEGSNLSIPHAIAGPNASASDVRRKLDEISGLSRLDFASGNVHTPLDYRPSFRDLMAFVFQPQNVVANRDVLFYRAHTYEHREKLRRNILPYVLNAVTPEVLAAQHQLDQVHRELRRKQRDLERARQASSRWEAEMAGQLSRARELGLAEAGVNSDLSQEAMLRLLRDVAKKTVDDFHSSSTTVSQAVEELVRLEAVESKLSSELTMLKSRQSELSRLREGAGSYKEALLLQQDRLAISEWLAAQPAPSEGCPLCGSDATAERAKVKALRTNLAQIEATAGQVSELPAAVDREVEQIRRALDDAADQLAGIRRQKRALTQSSSEAQKRQFGSLSAAHFLGQLSQALSLYDEVTDDGDLAAEVLALRERAEALSASIDGGRIERLKETALDRISAEIGRFMPTLDNDHPNDPARLVINDLTIRIRERDGDSYLWNVGSGSNWLSYHLSVMLALQSFFLAQRRSPVPGLLVFDQPSQAYFPEKASARRVVRETPTWTDEDSKAVRKAFELFGRVVTEFDGRLQIIILDHAPEPVWGRLPNVTLAENWRTGVKLVPTHWPGADD
jgi:hypothetical protein